MEDILRFLENGSNVTLISPRRYGKTGLIYQIFDSLKEQKKKVELFYVDIYATSCVDDFIAVLAEAVSKELKKDQLVKSFFQKLGRIRPVISQDALSGEPKLSFAFQTDAQRRYFLKALLEFLEHRPTRVIVAIDEFQQIREYEGLSMEALLRTHIQPLINVQFIFSGSKKHTMAEMFTAENSPFYESASLYTLEKIDREVYARFIGEHAVPVQQGILDRQEGSCLGGCTSGCRCYFEGKRCGLSGAACSADHQAVEVPFGRCKRGKSE